MASTDQKQNTDVSKVEPQNHTRAGTPELANEDTETTSNQKSQNPVIANGAEDKKSNEQQVIVEHPGARDDTDNRNSATQEKDLNEPESRKVEPIGKAPVGEKSTENSVSNKKTSRSCIVI